MEWYLLCICIGDLSIKSRNAQSNYPAMVCCLPSEEEGKPWSDPCQCSACSWQSGHGYLWLQNTERREHAKEDASSTEAKPRMQVRYC